MYLAFDRSYASSQGIPTRLMSYLMMTVVAITIVLAIRIMGIVLLLSLFTIPTAIASTLKKSYAHITFYSALIAIVGAVVGIIVSYYWEIPPGSCIIFLLTVMLITVKTLSLRSKKKNRCS